MDEEINPELEKRILTKHKGVESIVAIVFLLVFILGIFIWDFLEDNTTMIFLLILGIIFFVISSKSKKLGPLFKTVALFIIIHLVIFPNIYLYHLNRTPKGIEFYEKITKSEKEIALQNLQKIYSPKNLSENRRLIKDIQFNNTRKLDSPISYFSDNNILVLNKYLLYKGYLTINNTLDDEINQAAIMTTPPPIESSKIRDILVVCDSSGTFVTSLYHPSVLNFIDEGKQLSDFIDEVADYSNERLIQYELNRKKIELEDQFWDYNKILPFVFTSLFTDNMKPVSRTAQWMFGIHYVIIFFIVAALLSNYLGRIFPK
ncbi:hypothetical protein SAMN04487891_101108 [Flagellimonas taeanensis]|uniref:Uncharacterized protein n=1 Tax=Flagellimonas taeanensis TaxID=1005926 RepID=A0A1M6PB49_9FLAO|nr:hypothetical protein [Allomuricauda taeanensis]SFB66522.1 hypothetical protein SAMN04487891_101108 [Allomuricauda taeanensis]SHK05158.1 hypothetical protein SAMN05216293_0109 [Allomuricauda taeanensis]